jgi:hypothetical protein
LRFWRLLLGYFWLDVVRGPDFPRACFTRTILPHP